MSSREARCSSLIEAGEHKRQSRAPPDDQVRANGRHCPCTIGISHIVDEGFPGEYQADVISDWNQKFEMIQSKGHPYC